MADILDEVESDYHAERLRDVARRYGWLVVALLIALMAGAGLWQFLAARQARLNAAAGAAYLAASSGAESLVPGDRAGRLAAADRLAAFAAHAPAGYRAIARLRQAGLLADAGQLAAAQTVWDGVATDPQTDPMLRQLASLLWVERGIDASDPAALRNRLLSLTSGDNPFRPLALEAQAMLDLRLGQTEAARALLRGLVSDPGAPQGVRGRDNAILSRLGG